jgi:hypothetical protein
MKLDHVCLRILCAASVRRDLFRQLTINMCCV